MRLLALILLVPAFAFAQGLTTYPPPGPPVRTNWALRSNGMTSGTAAVAPWTMQAGSVATVADAPAYVGGGTWAEVTNTINNNALLQSITIPAAKSLAGSVWMAKSSGTGAASFAVYCGNLPSACACSGGGCVASIGNSDRCVAKVASLGTAPVRVKITVTCATAITGAYFNLFGGEYGVSTGTTRFTGAQLESATPVVRPLCVTTTVAKTCRN